jgi:hypothetical protein
MFRETKSNSYGAASKELKVTQIITKPASNRRRTKNEQRKRIWKRKRRSKTRYWWTTLL